MVWFGAILQRDGYLPPSGFPSQIVLLLDESLVYCEVLWLKVEALLRAE